MSNTSLARCDTRSPSGRARHALLWVLASALLLTACSGGGGAERAAEQWMDALNSGNLTRAKELSTEPTQALLQMGIAMGEDMAIGDYKIIRVNEISDTRAEVVVQTDEGENTLALQKVDGDWKVGFQK